MEKNTNTQSKISFWGLFIFMGIMGAFIGLLSIGFRSKVPDPDISMLVAFLMGYVPCQLVAIIFWLASRAAGHKNGMPIR
jgi:hypothetical protein